jgi:glycine cleavage system H protein
MGLDHYAQAAAKEIGFVELPRVGRWVDRGKSMGSVESGKWVGLLYAMVTGEVAAVNGDLANDPALINRDPYGAGWIAKIKLRVPGQLATLRRCTDPEFAIWFNAELEKRKAK